LTNATLAFRCARKLPTPQKTNTTTIAPNIILISQLVALCRRNLSIIFNL